MIKKTKVLRFGDSGDKRKTRGKIREGQFLQKLQDAGLSKELEQKVVDSPDNSLAERLVRMISRASSKESISQGRARDILQGNFISIDEVGKYFKFDPTTDQKKRLREVPFSVDILLGSRETHILVPIFPMSILDMGKRTRCLYGMQGDKPHRRRNVFEEDFVEEKGEIGWRLVRKEPLIDTTLKSWSEQNSRLSYWEDVPTAQVVVFATVAYGLATKGGLSLRHSSVRTSSVSNNGNMVVVGGRDSFWRGVGVQSRYPNGYRFLSIGLATEVVPLL